MTIATRDPAITQTHGLQNNRLSILATRAGWVISVGGVDNGRFICTIAIRGCHQCWCVNWFSFGQNGPPSISAANKTPLPINRLRWVLIKLRRALTGNAGRWVCTPKPMWWLRLHIGCARWMYTPRITIQPLMLSKQ